MRSVISDVDACVRYPSQAPSMLLLLSLNDSEDGGDTTGASVHVPRNMSPGMRRKLPIAPYINLTLLLSIDGRPERARGAKFPSGEGVYVLPRSGDGLRANHPPL